MNLVKNIVNVLLANIIELLSSTIVTFFIPLKLGIDDYACYKLFLLYVSYIGLISLGFYDGVYLQCGGKNSNESFDSDFVNNSIIFCIYLFVLACFGGILSIIIDNKILMIFSLSIVPYNLFNLFKRFYQATGEFKKYRNSMIIYSLTYLLYNLLLLFVFNITDYFFFCLSSTIANSIVLVYNATYIIKNFQVKLLNRLNYVKYVTVCKQGGIILIGNVLVSMIYNIDKWFVKFKFTLSDFAYYSFAVSMINLIMTVVQALSLTFYNFLIKTKEINIIRFSKAIVTCFGTLSISAFFVLSYIVKNYLSNYAFSLNIIRITFGSLPFIILINTIYINLYKANKNETKYLISIAFMLIVSIILNCFAILFDSMIWIAVMTSVSFAIWYFKCQNDMRNYYKINFEYTYLFFVIFLYYIFSMFPNSIVGLLLFFVSWLVLSVIFLLINRFNKKFINNILEQRGFHYERDNSSRW